MRNRSLSSTDWQGATEALLAFVAVVIRSCALFDPYAAVALRCPCEILKNTSVPRESKTASASIDAHRLAIVRTGCAHQGTEQQGASY
jgi:hypothetical protein